MFRYFIADMLNLNESLKTQSHTEILNSELQSTVDIENQGEVYSKYDIHVTDAGLLDTINKYVVPSPENNGKPLDMYTGACERNVSFSY